MHPLRPPLATAVRDRPHRRREEGLTLVELAVAMGIFSMVLGVFFATVRLMAATTARVYGVTTTGAEVRQATDVLSRQLGSASAVNLPVRVGTAWYLEFQSDAVKAGSPPQCTQWRYTSSTGLFQYRVWSTVTPGTPAWVTVVRSMNNDPATQPPFTLLGSDAGFTVMRVAVDLRTRTSTGALVQTQGQYTMRNSLDAPVPTASTVCTQLGRP